MTVTEIILNQSLISKLVTWVVPFLLGLFSSFFIDRLRSFRKNKRNKKFILMYLKNTILEELPNMEKEFSDLKNKIEKYHHERLRLSAFENFNANPLNGITAVEYYEIFKEEYKLVNEIITLIEFLRKSSPGSIGINFYDKINAHLKEKDKIGDIEHLKTCERCIQLKGNVLFVLDERLKETELLRSKINTLIK